MKEYISPKAKVIELETEGHLLDGSGPSINREEGGEQEFSNRRGSIWGNTEW